jgi:excinuclease UvrABC helicase subunit UvrB
MTNWFRRGHDEAAPTPPPPDPDAPDALLRRLWELIQFVNRSAGHLPTDAVVLARRVTDTLREVIDTSSERELDAHAVAQLNGIVGDYLPTTLRTYLALDPSVTDTVLPTGRTPKAELREQLEALLEAADDLLGATRANDVNALLAQGSFLRTKFTRSDLDL